MDWIGLAKMARSSWSAPPHRVEVSARNSGGVVERIGKDGAQLLVRTSTEGGSQRQEFGCLVHIILLIHVHCLRMVSRVSGLVAYYAIKFLTFISKLALTSCLIRQSLSAQKLALTRRPYEEPSWYAQKLALPRRPLL